MDNSQSDSDDDSYYERLCAAAPGDMDELEPNESKCHDVMDATILGDIETEQTETEDEDAYFERLERAGEVESEVVLPETDPIWDILSASLSKDPIGSGSAASRVLVPAQSLGIIGGDSNRGSHTWSPPEDR